MTDLIDVKNEASRSSVYDREKSMKINHNVIRENMELTFIELGKQRISFGRSKLMGYS
jgi:hypothetical protein